MYNPFSLTGKTILVTGASSGIGKSIAIECSKMGANVIIIGRDKDRLQNTYDNLLGDNNLMYYVELTSDEGVADFVRDLPVLNGLVNAAGILKKVPFRSHNPKSFQEVMNVNFFAPAMLTQELLRRKKILKSSSIVFISSISGNNCSYVGNSAYSSSKGAINAMSRNIALELASRDIRVNTVNPGMVETNMIHTKEMHEEQIREDMANYPLQRYGKPEDIAYAVIYLLSEASSWVTGSSLLIDGGFTLK